MQIKTDFQNIFFSLRSHLTDIYLIRKLQRSIIMYIRQGTHEKDKNNSLFKYSTEWLIFILQRARKEWIIHGP